LRREKGFKAAIEAAPNVELVAEQFTDGSTAGALNTAVNMLTRFVEDNELKIDGIFASNLPTSLGMQKALNRLRKQGVKVHARFVGFDSSEELVRGLEAGEIDALVVQNPVKIGYMGVKTMVEHLQGKEVPKYIDTGVELVTKERLKEPAIRALVGLEE
jgi:ribose transport system substrate-binding protein